MNNRKTYTLYAGVNGAGKSTIYKVVSQAPDEARINPDEILLKNGGDWKNTNDQIAAMQECVKKLHQYIKDGVSFNQETTLSGRSIFSTVQKARENGYLIKLFYIGLESADLAVQRVQQRVQKGGHGIDEATVRKRYSVSMTALRTIIPLCDVVEIFDNTSEFTSVAKYKNGEWIEFDFSCKWLVEALPDVHTI